MNVSCAKNSLRLFSPTQISDVDFVDIYKSRREMSRVQKYGFILLACFICIVLVANLYVSRNLTWKSGIPFPSYLTNLSIYFNKNNSSNSQQNADSNGKSVPGEKQDSPSSSYIMTSVNKHRIPDVVAETLEEIPLPHPLLPKSFKTTLQEFPLTDFANTVGTNDKEKALEYNELLLKEMSYFLELEPLVPINHTCQPPPLPPLSEIHCADYPEAFKGVKDMLSSSSQQNPVRKIGTLVQFGFDVDTLEIHLNELHGVVDKFFIIESTHAHYGKLKKPLLWDRIQEQERFKKFDVVHLIVDDASASHASLELFSMEKLQERQRWLKFIEWNDETKYFSDDDIIGFGDADEIPNRTKLYLLKYCELSGNSVDFGIWFPFGRIDQAFRSDFPVRGHPFTLGDPTYYKVSGAKSYGVTNPSNYPNRKRGGSGLYLLGGMHMTHYGYLPYQIVKRATATEYGFRLASDVTKLANYIRNDDIRKMELDYATMPSEFKPRIIPIDLNNLQEDLKEICILPWFYNCNRDRYPVWESRHDTRLV